jgi:hypothetical protein
MTMTLESCRMQYSTAPRTGAKIKIATRLAKQIDGGKRAICALEVFSETMTS